MYWSSNKMLQLIICIHLPPQLPALGFWCSSITSLKKLRLNCCTVVGFDKDLDPSPCKSEIWIPEIIRLNNCSEFGQWFREAGVHPLSFWAFFCWDKINMQDKVVEDNILSQTFYKRESLDFRLCTIFWIFLNGTELTLPLSPNHVQSYCLNLRVYAFFPTKPPPPSCKFYLVSGT